MNEKQWDKLAWKKLYKPFLLIAFIPYGIALIISIFFGEYPFILTLCFGSMYVILILFISLAGGLDFVNRYGYRDNRGEQKE